MLILVATSASTERRHYTGEWSELALADWVMAQEVPLFGRLARSVDEGAETDDYATKFFSSTLVKFIAFVREDQATPRQVREQQSPVCSRSPLLLLLLVSVVVVAGLIC